MGRSKLVMLDEISRLNPPEPVKGPQWRLPQLPILRRNRPVEEYPGATIMRMRGDTYQAIVARGTVWVLEKARVEVRWTGRRVRSRARYLIGYVHNCLSVVFLEFVGAPVDVSGQEALHFWLDRLVEHLTPEVVAMAFEVMQRSVMKSRGQPGTAEVVMP